MEINGLKVVDANKHLTLHITKQDVRLGANKDPGSCAAARCALRTVNGIVKARVHIGRTYLQVGKKWVRYLTPQSLRSEIISFDRKGGFEPGDYILSPLSPAHATGKRYGGQKRAYKKTGRKRAKYHTVHGVRAHGANR